MVTAKGMQLIDTELRQMGGRTVATVYINKENGIGVDDCADVSRELDVLLEAEGTMPGAYTLEVSSPGLTRPLKTVEDFKEKMGEQIKVKYLDENETLISSIGRLEGVNESELILVNKKDSYNIKLSTIKSAKMEVNI